MRSGFTLVELLVTIGVISVLIAVLLPGLNSARRAGIRTEESAAARQLVMAWQMYAIDSDDRVLPGYKSGLSATTADGRPVGDIPSRRYPWRLAPYLNYDFRGLYTGEHRDVLEALEQTEDYLYTVSVSPSLGLNTTWVGGDENHLGFNRAFTRVYGQFYVRTVAEIRRPDRLLLFASARGSDPFDLEAPVTEGYFRIDSPVLTMTEGDRWAEEYRAGDPPESFGQLSFRHGGQAVVAYPDAHVGTATPAALRDMRVWSNRATAPDEGLTPRE